MFADYQIRLMEVEADRKVSLQEKKIEKKNQVVQNDKVFRGATSEEITSAPKKALYTFDHSFKKVKYFTSTAHPDTIESAIDSYLQGMEVTPLIHQSKYKMDVEYPNKAYQNIKT